jgi:hypothetical protein
MLLLFCIVCLVGFAERGHAFSLFGGGGGGGKRTHVDMGTVGKFDYRVFQNQGSTTPNQNSNLTDENLRHYLDGSNNGYGENGHGGGGIIIGDSDDGGGYRGKTGDAQTNGTAPVPEPTTMLLLGAGLISLASFGRKILA